MQVHDAAQGKLPVARTSRLCGFKSLTRPGEPIPTIPKLGKYPELGPLGFTSGICVLRRRNRWPRFLTVARPPGKP